MPPLPVIPNAFRVTLNWEKAGVPSVHNVCNVAGAFADEQDVLDFFNEDDNVEIDQFAYVSSSYSWVSTTVLQYDGVSVGVTGARETPIAGGAAGQPILELAGLVSLRTAHRGPSGRGRLYLGPATESIWDGAALTVDPNDVRDAWDLFRAGLVGAGLALVVVSLKDEVAYPVTSVICTTRGVTQVSRLRATR